MHLRHKGILLTRPLHQVSYLQQAILNSGGIPLLFPTLDIKPVDNLSLQTAIRRLDKAHIAIFTSVNAVITTASLIKKAWRLLPKDLQIAAIGATTKRALEAQGWPVSLFPSHEFNSENLLALPEFSDVADKHIVIFSGEGGRNLLQEVLARRGAKVYKVASYQRCCPHLDIEQLQRYWQNNQIDIIVSTSNESFNNLFNSLNKPSLEYLQQTPLLVISQRMAIFVQNIGYKMNPLIAKNATDDAIMQALLSWSSTLANY